MVLGILVGVILKNRLKVTCKKKRSWLNIRRILYSRIGTLSKPGLIVILIVRSGAQRQVRDRLLNSQTLLYFNLLHRIVWLLICVMFLDFLFLEKCRCFT